MSQGTPRGGASSVIADTTAPSRGARTRGDLQVVRAADRGAWGILSRFFSSDGRSTGGYVARAIVNAPPLRVASLRSSTLRSEVFTIAWPDGLGSPQFPSATQSVTHVAGLFCYRCSRLFTWFVQLNGRYDEHFGLVKDEIVKSLQIVFAEFSTLGLKRDRTAEEAHIPRYGKEQRGVRMIPGIRQRNATVHANALVARYHR